MTKKLDSKGLFKLLAIVLAIQIACVFPGVANTGSTREEIPEVTQTPFFIEKEHYESVLDCEDEKFVLAIVLASENGGLNMRDNPLDEYGNGGNVLRTISNGTEINVIRKNVTDGWDFVRDSDACGFVNNKYLLYVEKPLGE